MRKKKCLVLCLATILYLPLVACGILEEESDQEYLPYFTIMVKDVSDPNLPNPFHVAGADISAISLSNGGYDYYPNTIHHCEFGSDDNTAANDCNMALGWPSGLCDSASPDFVSLGGPDGVMIMSNADQNIDTGNQIQVFECKLSSDDDDYYDVYVGTGTDPNDPNWVKCIEDGRATSIGIVPALPQIPIE